MEDGKMKMRIPKRVYTAQYREAAVRQVIDAGRSAAEVGRSLEMSEKTLAKRGTSVASEPSDGQAGCGPAHRRGPGQTELPAGRDRPFARGQRDPRKGSGMLCQTVARRPRRHIRTTDARHDLATAPNVLDRYFAADAPNHIWLADITYVGTGGGWLYVALVLDLFSRCLVRWASIEGQLTADALALTLGLHRPGTGLLHHSDRGVQYCAHAYRDHLAQHGITVSMSRRANCYDKAPMESANGTVKVERVHDQHYATRQEAIGDLTEYIGYHNTERRHSALGYLSPVEYETRWASNRSTPPPGAASYPPPGALPAYEAPHACAWRTGYPAMVMASIKRGQLHCGN
jgi:transposase InsO family protein